MKKDNLNYVEIDYTKLLDQMTDIELRLMSNCAYCDKEHPSETFIVGGMSVTTCHDVSRSSA